MTMEHSDETKPESPALAGLRVLVVEDAPEDVAKFEQWLSVAGAEVTTVLTLGAATQAFREGGHDAVVIDRLLPDGDAFEWLSREHRERGALSRVPPCVLVSGHIDAKVYRATYDLGAVPLPKHYILHPDVLLAAITSAFRFAGVQQSEFDPRRHPLMPRC
jgi:CheY-like chemotaxis protein